jgi:hypothetical protein
MEPTRQTFCEIMSRWRAAHLARWPDIDMMIRFSTTFVLLWLVLAILGGGCSNQEGRS